MANIIVSKNRLQEYIKGELPDDSTLAEKLTMHIFEVEGVEKKGDDTAFDIKVLPDRSGYCFSHKYVAQELAAILDLPYEPINFEKIDGRGSVIKMEIKDKYVNPLHICRKISGIKNTESPDWLRNTLATIGQRSINLVVDLTNFVMFDTGQPVHAFDADKVNGELVVRYATDDESIELLDGKKIDLDEDVLVIADDNGLLDITGIKGGKRAEVTEETENIILIAGHFDPTYIRKTSQRLNIKNDSSKRFENAVTIERPQLAIDEFSALLLQNCNQNPSDLSYGKISKFGDDKKEKTTLIIDHVYINQRIGINIELQDMMQILRSLDFSPKEAGTFGKVLINIPVYRADIKIQEDVAEEIARLYGLEKLEDKLPEHMEGRDILLSLEYANRIRAALVEIGFSEIYTYTLRDQGDIELANPLNIERSHLRDSIGEAFPKVLELNLRNADLLGLKAIKIFEIGHVFKGKKEHVSMAIGIAANPGKEGKAIIEQGLDSALMAIGKVFGIKVNEIPMNGIDNGILEINLGDLLQNAEEPTDEININLNRRENVVYKKFSPYPYISRDIAVFIPGPSGKSAELRSVIESLDSDLIVNIYQFDEFEKKNENGEVEKTSYAFRIIFQSNERTLTDAEVEEVMQKLNSKIVERGGWDIR